MATGQATSTFHTMAVLQVYQVKMLQERSPEAFRKLEFAIDLVIRVKKTTHGIRHSMGSLVALQHYL